MSDHKPSSGAAIRNMIQGIVEVLLALIGVVRHRTDRMITIAYEVVFVAWNLLKGPQRRSVVRHDEQSAAAQPRMGGIAG
ncbi:hypothetical protein ACIQZO_18005 [Streptomyces sp. NPDC097617]|uniref:hypothetical protein n=1 Tax=Streptomyces sp. NPDC097617 TaxID=3366091 RepID=UPI003819B2D0